MHRQFLHQPNQAAEQRQRCFQVTILLCELLHERSRTYRPFRFRNGLHSNCHAWHQLLLIRRHKFRSGLPKHHEHNCAFGRIWRHHVHWKIVHRVWDDACVSLYFQRGQRPPRKHQTISINALPCRVSALLRHRVILSRHFRILHRHHFSVLLRRFRTTRWEEHRSDMLLSYSTRKPSPTSSHSRAFSDPSIQRLNGAAAISFGSSPYSVSAPKGTSSTAVPYGRMNDNDKQVFI